MLQWAGVPERPLLHLTPAYALLFLSPTSTLNYAFSWGLHSPAGLCVGTTGTYRWEVGGKNEVALWSVLRVGRLSQQHDRR